MQADARGQAIQAPSVTILATPAQAELLTLAGNDGKVQLVLRNSSDQGMEKTEGRVVSELYGNRPTPKPVVAPAAPRAAAPRPVTVAAAPPPPPAPVVPPPPPPDQVVMIRGTARTVETLPNRN
jgi:pilus assembly protein CpaB